MKQDLAKETRVARNLSRREVLGLMGATAAASIVGCAGGESASGEQAGAPTQAVNASIPRCVVSPGQTEGPYFVDERLNRSDIRSEPPDGSVKQGVPLRLVLNVSQVTGSSCTPLPGATVDIWQCDALGSYSGVLDRFEDTRGRKFLRGYQVTDAAGRVQFTTIYPGWYTGRTVHIHFKIRTDPASEFGQEFSSQLYFDESITDQVHAQQPYASRGRRDTTNSRDGIFRRGGDKLMLRLTKDVQGYTGTLDIGLRMA